MTKPNPKFLFGKVMHARLRPKINKFIYGIYYLACPLSRLDDLPMPRNKWGFWSFYDKDHGRYDGSDLEIWARDILKEHGINKADGDIILICMPRILGYVFNPVSFWLCKDKDGHTRAVLCEVHNTFGEKHTYLCAHADQSIIQGDQTIKGEKVFHVSPFMKREGRYEFRFDVQEDTFGVWIDFLDPQGEMLLLTSLKGDLKDISARSKAKAFWGYPLITFKTIMLIHWQAIKLLFKGIRYVPKPKQKEEKLSATENIKKI